MEDITDVHYVRGKRVCKDFKRKNLGDYHYLYVQRNTLCDVFEYLGKWLNGGKRYQRWHMLSYLSVYES